MRSIEFPHYNILIIIFAAADAKNYCITEVHIAAAGAANFKSTQAYTAEAIGKEYNHAIANAHSLNNSMRAITAKTNHFLGMPYTDENTTNSRKGVF